MEKTACLIVDVQQALTNALPDKGEALTGQLTRLISWCRRQGVLVAYVRHDGGEGNELQAGSAGWEIDSRLAPKPSEHIFEKSYNSAFLETDLESWCSSEGITQLIVAGMQTEYCIDATIKSAFEKGYQILVPQNGCATFDNEFFSAEQTERFFEEHIWHDRFARVFPLESLIAAKQ